MNQDTRTLAVTLIIIVPLAGLAAFVYSSQQNIPPRVAWPLAVAFLVETALYVSSADAAGRRLAEAIAPRGLRALLIWFSALVPYLVYAALTHTFRMAAFAGLAALAGLISCWYVLFHKKQLWADLFFIGIAAALVLSRFFPSVYVQLAPKADAALLGKLMWIRLQFLAVLSIRGMSGIRLGLFPERREWLIGAIAFVLFVPVAVVLAPWLHVAAPRALTMPWWKIGAALAGNFLAFLWVVGLWEEFLCRGMLQQLLTGRVGRWAALVVTSIAFGLAHLPFRGFPNWRFATIAAAAGVFYGWAYQRAAGIRAAAVAHALVVTAWRVFFL